MGRRYQWTATLVGPGSLDAAVAVDAQLLVGFCFAPGGSCGVPAAVAPRRGTVTPPPSRDGDGDGIFGSADRCPLRPEDEDGYDDEDGCPDLDDDQDGVDLPSDHCPSEAETRNGREDTDGCPDQLPTMPRPSRARPCQGPDDCASALCLVDGQDRLCSVTCTSDAECPSDYHCATAAIGGATMKCFPGAPPGCALGGRGRGRAGGWLAAAFVIGLFYGFRFAFRRGGMNSLTGSATSGNARRRSVSPRRWRVTRR